MKANNTLNLKRVRTTKQHFPTKTNEAKAKYTPFFFDVLKSARSDNNRQITTTTILINNQTQCVCLKGTPTNQNRMKNV